MGWHWLASLTLTGIAVLVCNSAGVSGWPTLFIASAVFVSYWLGVIVIFGPGDGGGFDLDIF